MANQRRASNLDFRSRLDIKGIRFDNRFATATGLRSLDSVNKLSDIIAVIHRIIGKDSVGNTVQSLTVSVPSVNIFFIRNTSCGGDFHCHKLTVADGILVFNLNSNLGIFRYLDGNGIATFANSSVRMSAFNGDHDFMIGSISKRIVEVCRRSTRHFCTVNIPLIGHVACIVTDNGFKVHRTVFADGGVADYDVNNRCTIYIYGEVDAFGFATVATVNFHSVEVSALGSHFCLNESVFGIVLDHVAIEIPCISGSSGIGSGKFAVRSGDFTLQGNFVAVGIAEILGSHIFQSDSNVDVLNNKDGVGNRGVATRSVLDETDRIINHTGIGNHRVIADGIGDIAVHHDTVLVPSISTVIIFFTIDCNLECYMATVTDCVVGSHLCDNKIGFGNHLHGVNTFSLAVDTCLLNQHTVFLISARGSFGNVRASNGGSTRDCICGVCIVEPFVEDTCCLLVADVGRQGHIRTLTNGILIVSDLHIDGIVHIDVVRFTCCRATKSIVCHHKCEHIGIGTSGEYGVNGVGTRLECRIGLSPFVSIVIKVVVDISSQFDSVVQTDHRGTGNLNCRHRADNGSIDHNRVGSTTADALGHLDRVDVTCLGVVLTGEGFREHGISHAGNFYTISIPFIYISRRSITCADLRSCRNRHLGAGADGVGSGFYSSDFGIFLNCNLHCVAGCITGRGQTGVACVILIHVNLVLHILRRGNGDGIADKGEGVIVCDINPFVSDSRNLVGGGDDKREVNFTTFTNYRVGSHQLHNRCGVHLNRELCLTPRITTSSIRTGGRTRNTKLYTDRVRSACRRKQLGGEIMIRKSRINPNTIHIPLIFGTSQKSTHHRTIHEQDR